MAFISGASESRVDGSNPFAMYMFVPDNGVLLAIFKNDRDLVGLRGGSGPEGCRYFLQPRLLLVPELHCLVDADPGEPHLVRDLGLGQQVQVLGDDGAKGGVAAAGD